MLAKRAITFVACFEPLSHTSYMELVLAVFARHSWETLVSRVKHTVADHAVLNSLDLFVDVALPKEDGRDDVSVP